MEETLIKRVMPNSLEAEQSVIGSMIMDQDAIVTAMEILLQEDFYHKQYGILFDAMIELYSSGQPVDLVTLQNKLKEKDVPQEVSSLEFVGELVRAVPTSANVKYYCNIVKENSMKRKLIRVTEEIENECYAGKESLESLDGVGLFISRAFSNLFVKDATIVDKFVSFNLLVTKFEAYLKKLFYLMNGEEVKPQYEGQDVTWKDVIHAIRPLWTLKYNENDEYQKLYQYLMLVKGWRNDESHISPTASEQEINAAINIIITMYFFATGSCITELESAGHDVEDNSNCHVSPFAPSV